MERKEFRNKVKPGDLVWIVADIARGDRFARNSGYTGIYYPIDNNLFSIKTQVSFDGVNDSDFGIGFGGNQQLLYSSVDSVTRILSAKDMAKMGAEHFGPNAQRVYLKFFG